MSERRQTMSNSWSASPADIAMSDAIELAIAEESPYPEQSFFLDADAPNADREMRRAARDGYSIVLVAAGGDIQIIVPEEIPGESEMELRSWPAQLDN